MKYLFFCLICFLSLTLFSQTEIELRTDGIVVPRLDTTSVNAPTMGQVIYDTTEDCMKYYNGDRWKSLTGPFELNGSVVRQNSNSTTQDFVFGSSELPHPVDPTDDVLFFFDESKGAFRGGAIVFSTNWAKDSLGDYSLGYGIDVNASGSYATALGFRTTASGTATTALGSGTSASGQHATALGSLSAASGRKATAIGYGTEASGDNGATALGNFTEASGNNGATALGNFTEATGNSVTVVGTWNDTIVATGTPLSETSPLFIVGNGNSTNQSNAMVVLKNGEVSFENYTFPILDGTSTQILSTDGNGQLSWTNAGLISNGGFEKRGNLIRQVTDTDNDDFIFGRSTTPSGNITDKFFFYDQLTSSFRGGNLNNSDAWNSSFRGVSSFGYGENIVPSGDRSTAFGLNTLAVGENTFAIGEATKAESMSTVAIGRYNIGGGNASAWTNTDPLFEIGIGTSDMARENAVTVLKNGKVGIGTSAPSSQLHQTYNSNTGDAHIRLTEKGPDGSRIMLENDQNNNYWTIFGRPYTTAASSQINFHYKDDSGNTSNIFRIYGDGNAWLKGTLTQPSDRRLKKNIKKIENALSTIDKIGGYTYNWKKETNQALTQFGVIAQEVQKVLPEIVKVNDDGILSVSYSSLIPILLEGMKEQQEIIDQVLKANIHLKKENNHLKKEIAEIKAFIKM